MRPCFFSVIFRLTTEMIYKWPKKVSLVRISKIMPSRLMNTAMASFNTTVRQMTETFQWPKFLSKKWPKRLSGKTDHSIIPICNPPDKHHPEVYGVWNFRLRLRSCFGWIYSDSAPTHFKIVGLRLLLKLQSELSKLLAVSKWLYPVFALKRLKNGSNEFAHLYNTCQLLLK